MDKSLQHFNILKRVSVHVMTWGCSVSTQLHLLVRRYKKNSFYTFLTVCLKSAANQVKQYPIFFPFRPFWGSASLNFVVKRHILWTHYETLYISTVSWSFSKLRPCDFRIMKFPKRLIVTDFAFLNELELIDSLNHTVGNRTICLPFWLSLKS